VGFMGKFSNADIGMPIKEPKQSGSGKKGLSGRRGEDWKVLQKAGDTYRHGKDVERKPVVYGRKEERGAFYNNNIPLKELNEKLGRFRGTVRLVNGAYMFVPSDGRSIKVFGEKDYWGKDFVRLKGARQIANYLSKGVKSGEQRLPPKVSSKEMESPDKIYSFLVGGKAAEAVKSRGLESTLVLVGLFIFSIIGLLLIMQKTSPTGFVVGELADSSINTGVLLCILGIIGLLFYRFKFSD
jgi:hypothetical protein